MEETWGLEVYYKIYLNVKLVTKLKQHKITSKIVESQILTLKARENVVRKKKAREDTKQKEMTSISKAERQRETLGERLVSKAVEPSRLGPK